MHATARFVRCVAARSGGAAMTPSLAGGAVLRLGTTAHVVATRRPPRAAPRRAFATAVRGPPAAMPAIADPKRKRERRRRRPTAAPKRAAVVDDDDPARFLERAARLADRVAAAFAGLDGVATSREGGVVVVDLGADRGAFTLAPNDDARTVSLLSPVSGAQTYKWDTRAEAWKHVDDDHDVTGLLVRDYLRAGCVGLPDL